MENALDIPQIPKIKVRTQETPVQERPEDHQYQPYHEATPGVQTASTLASPEKTVGEMSQEDFSKLLVKGMIEASRIQARSAKARTEEPTTAAGKVMATIGDTAHGIVDIAEGVVRGCVDIVTFGQSKRH